MKVKACEILRHRRPTMNCQKGGGTKTELKGHNRVRKLQAS